MIGHSKHRKSGHIPNSTHFTGKKQEREKKRKRKKQKNKSPHTPVNTGVIYVA